MLTILYGGNWSGQVIDLPEAAGGITFGGRGGAPAENYIRQYLPTEQGNPFLVFTFNGMGIRKGNITVHVEGKQYSIVVIDEEKVDVEEDHSCDVVNRASYLFNSDE